MFCKNCGTEINYNVKFCKNCGQEIKIGRFTILHTKFFEWLKGHRKALLAIVGVLALMSIVVIYNGSSNDGTSSSFPVEQTLPNQSYKQMEVTSSVVNILCPSTVAGENGTGGSGTIISEDGVIITNSHIIPQDKKELHVGEKGCLIVLPDPATGQPKDFYLAHPIVIPGLSDDYDLAYMKIYSAYYDDEKHEFAGQYPRKFPAFDDTTRCRNENVQLGEPIRIFGYPAISGGYSLTVTDGVVSSFPGDGLIVTSAKISHGNSGGLAVDRYGCMIGIPSMVSSDEAESLGVIISTSIINKFYGEVSTYIDNLK